MRAQTTEPEPDPDAEMTEAEPGTGADAELGADGGEAGVGEIELDEAVAQDGEPQRKGRRRRFRNPLARLLRRGGPAEDEGGGRRCLLLAEPAHIDGVRSKLAEGGVDVVSVALDMPSLMDGLAAFEPDLVVIDLPETPTLMIE